MTFKNLMSTFIIQLFIVLFLYSNCNARDLMLAGVPNEPMRYIDSNGKVSGIDIEIIDYIFNKMNIKYNVTLIRSASRLEYMWQHDKPELDMVLTYSHNNDREKYLNYSEESHITISWNFFILKKNEGKLVYNSFEDLKNHTVGATTDYAYTKEFWDAASKGIFKIDKQPVNEFQMKKLLGERFEFVPMNTISTLYQAKLDGYLDKITYLPKPLKTQLYYNTFVKKSSYPNLNDIIKKYDDILREMKKQGLVDNILAEYGITKLN